MSRDVFGCGCCGAPVGHALWCAPCEGHVLTTGPIEERAWCAQTGERCPFSPEDDEPEVRAERSAA